MEQQHSARKGRKGPGQAQGQGHGQRQGQDQGHAPGRRKGTKPRAAAAAAAAGGRTASPVSASSTPGLRERESRRRGATSVAGREAAALYHAQLRFPLIPPRVTDALSWLPRARLTALGCGLLAVLLMVLTGGISRVLLENSVTFYGSVFILAAMACAAWVRPSDLFTAPVAVPLAFAAGLLLISGGAGTEGFMGHLTSLFPALAVNALWLYAGTLAAVLIVLVRKVALVVQTSRARALEEAQDEEAEDGLL